MIDVKKLITGFLILATAAVCSGLVLSLVSNSSTATATITPAATIAENATSSAANAFLPDEPTQIQNNFTPAQVASSSMMQSSTDPGNLTDALATEFVNGVVSANPNGPTNTDANGNPIIATPNVSAIAADLADATTTQNLNIPNWDIEVEAIPITVDSASNASSVFQYGTAVNNVLNNHFDSEVQSILSDQSGDTSASDLASVESQVQSALGDVAGLQTPAPAVAFQKSLLTTLVYDKNMLQLMDVAQTDPVKASLIFQSEEQKFNLAQQNFQTQAQKVSSLTLSLQTPIKGKSPFLSFMDTTFGIPQAQAQFEVFDPATWSLIEANQAQNIANEIEAIVKNTLLQILKNVLITLMQQKVLAWVQGSGAPRFITNWATVLVNSAQTSALNAINQQMSCGVYPAFIPQIKITLKSYYLPGANSCANQFAAALGSNSFQQFYNNFKNGGFVAFGAATLPSGNPYGQQFFSAQTVGLAVQGAQQATTLKTQTSQGFTGDQVCDDGSNPSTGEHTVCENPDGPDYTIQGSESCGPGDTPVVYANNGTSCDDGTTPLTTTPAAVTAFTLSNTEDANPKAVAAATDIVGLLNSVLSSLMLQLANQLVTTVNGAVSAGLQGVPPSNIGAPTAVPGNLPSGGTPPAPLPLACNPVSQTVPPTSVGTSTLPITISASGGTSDASGNPPTYHWVSSDGTTNTGSFFIDSISTPGTYTITLSDSVLTDAPATCTVNVQ